MHRVLLLAVAISAAVATPAHAFFIVGPSQVPDPNLTQDINYPDYVLFNASTPLGVRNTSPIDGVITSWRTYGAQIHGGATLRLRVLKDEGAGNWRVVRSGPAETPEEPDNGKATEQRFPARIPIPAGATISVDHGRPTGSTNVVTLVHDQPAPSPWTQGQYNVATPVNDGDLITPMVTDGSAGSSDPFFPNSAIVEADADHDDFGDETQDRCVGTAGGDAGCPSAVYGRAAPPAQGATILGPELEIDPATAVASNRPTSIVFNDVPAPGTQLQARFRGVVTRWSFFTGTVTAGATAQLRILRPIGGSTYVAVAEGPTEPLPAGAGPVELRSFAAAVPVAPGDVAAVALGRPDGGTLEVVAVKSNITPQVWSWAHFAGATGNARFLATGEQGVPSQQAYGAQLQSTFLPISAVVERDADGDASGDNTQDGCLDAFGTVGGCPAPSPTPSPTTGPAATPTPVIVLPARANAVIDPAGVKLSANRRQLTVRVTCPAQTAKTCDGTLKAVTAKVKRRRRKLGRRKVSVPQGTAKTLTLKVPKATRRALKRVETVTFTVSLGSRQTVTGSG